jgi:hypothetical protein
MKRLASVARALACSLVALSCHDPANPASRPSANVSTLGHDPSTMLAPNGVGICHQQGNGTYRLLNVPGNAEAAHRAHGDAAPGEHVPGDPYLTFDAACLVSATFDPVADYDAGWLSGSNPNGVWRYGWSSTLTSALTLYSQNYTTTQDCGGSTYRAWHDPTNDVGFTPAVIKNIGPACANGNVDIPTGVLTQHFGGLTGTDYSHVVFTAPFAGTYHIAITFTGRQHSLSSDANVLVNGSLVLTGLMTVNLQTFPYVATLTLSGGDTIDFATGPGPSFGLHPGHVGLSGTIVAVP